MILDLVVSTVAFFAAAWYVRRRFDEMDIPMGMTRSAAVFAVALIASYAVAAAVDWLAGQL
jgi:hypothetical protein